MRLIFQLDEPPVDAIRYCGDRVDARLLEEGGRTVMATVTRMGTFKHPHYGKFSITRKMLNDFVRNFDARTYGQDIFLDKDHNPSEGAAAVFRRLSIEDGKLRAELEFTPFGIELANKKGYRYLSAEFVEDYEDPESGEKHGALLRGAGFTIRPFVKNLDPVQLSETDDHSHLLILDRKVIRLLHDEVNAMWEKLRKQLEAKLKALKLSEKVVVQLCDGFMNLSETIGDNEKAGEALVTQFESQGKTLAEKFGDQEITIKIDMPSPQQTKTLSADEVSELVAKKLKETQDQAAAATKQLKETLDAKNRVLSETITAAKGLSEKTKGDLVKELGELITPEMSDDQIKRLAEHSIAKANEVEVARQLSGMGFQTTQTGSSYITVDDSNTVKQLQETADKRLGLLDLSDAKRYKKTSGVLLEENKKLAEETLAMFDAYNAVRLRQEAKMLAGGDGVVADTSVPATFERTVIREALYQLMGLQFVDVGTEMYATSHFIPYSYRDTSAAGRNDTRKYEGQSISDAGVIQTGDTVFPIPQKLSFTVSDEVRMLTSNGQLNWNVVIENQRNASRIIGEDLEQMLFNEQLNAADEYGAETVTDEDLEQQANGANKVFLLANWPVVRPRIIRNHAGTQVGNTINPITVTYNSVARSEYDGTGEQAAGIYYVLNYNLGEIYLVNETGVIQTPTDTTPYTISYSYATNVEKFDSDLGGDALDDHWDKFLTVIGNRKSEIEDQRFHTADFGLMSGSLENTVGQAKKFAANFRRPGTELSLDGNIGRIKDIAHFKTKAPGLYMGDQRTLVGERAQTRFRMTKPWAMEQLENKRDSSGDYIGKKHAYGTQFIVVHTPTPLKRALTSTVVYSATARVARAAP